MRWRLQHRSHVNKISISGYKIQLCKHLSLLLIHIRWVLICFSCPKVTSSHLLYLNLKTDITDLSSILLTIQYHTVWLYSYSQYFDSGISQTRLNYHVEEVTLQTERRNWSNRSDVFVYGTFSLLWCPWESPGWLSHSMFIFPNKSLI